MTKCRYRLFLALLILGGAVSSGDHFQSVARAAGEKVKGLRPKFAARALSATNRSALHKTRSCQSRITMSGL
jgi:hypothetical protein